LSSQAAGPLPDPPVLPEVAAVAREVDRLVKQTGKTPRQIVAAVGSAFSEATISRCRRGTNNSLPNDEMLAALFKLAGEPDSGRQRVTAGVAEARRAKMAGGWVVPEPPKPAPVGNKPPRTGGLPGWRTVLIAAAVTALAAFLVFALPGILDRGDLRSPGASPPGTTTTPSPVSPPTPPSSCDRWAVNAGRDLSMRDEVGVVTGQELPRDQQLTILNRRNPAGHSYWQVSTDDGVTGWVDWHYLRPLCPGS
jgi:hypothetical protein